MQSKNKTLKLAKNALFIAITLVLAYFGRTSIFPIFPHLKIDFSDVPVFAATLLYGVSSGATVLFISSFLRTLLFSSAGWPGFIMHLAAIVMVIFLGTFFKRKSNIFKKGLGLIAGMILTLCVKIPLNYFFWVLFFGYPLDFLNGIFLTIIFPYNFFKLLISIITALLIYNFLYKFEE